MQEYIPLKGINKNLENILGIINVSGLALILEKEEQVFGGLI